MIFSKIVVVAQPGIVHTIAGGGSSTADGVPALSAQFSSLTAICTDTHNNIYVCDRGAHKIRKIDASTGSIYTVAGNGTAGFSGDGGLATDAQLNINGGGFCVDEAGNMYVADLADHVIRMINGTTGIITTVAGGGSLMGNNIPATDAQLFPQAVNCDGNGNIYIADVGSYYVYKVNVSTGILTIAAGNGTSVFSGDGGPATNAGIGEPYALTFDIAGNLYIGEWYNNIRKVNVTTGIIETISTLYGSGMSPSLSIDMDKNIYFTTMASNHIRKIDATTGVMSAVSAVSGGEELDGIPITITATGGNAVSLCKDVAGNMYYISNLTKIRKINSPFSGMASYSGEFHVYTSKQCDGPNMSVIVPTYIAGEKMITLFGDGIADTSSILSSLGIGDCKLLHPYPASGSYVVKHFIQRSDTG